MRWSVLREFVDDDVDVARTVMERKHNTSRRRREAADTTN